MEFSLPHSALLRYLKTDAKPADIAKCLSLCGPTVDSLEKSGPDYIYHLEIITNRVDAASAFGIAREAAAILPEFGFSAKLLPLNLEPLNRQFALGQVPILDLQVVNLPDLNPRIMAVKIDHVSVAPSPKWLVDALIKYGQRSLNNLIDITNFVMFELGHPVHVFDYDRLLTKKIVVREAKKGEQLTTLDGQQHTLQGGEVIYDDGTGQIIDLPGIMGTSNSVVTDKTQTALIWIEDNNHLKIRQTSLNLQLRTQAAILNEKNVDPETSPQSLKLAVQLGLELAHGQIGSQILDIYPKTWQPKTVKFNHTWLEKFAGIALDPHKVLNILERLQFQPQLKNQTDYSCQIPSFRDADITRPEDLAEEVLRIYGYFRLPSVLPQTNLSAVPYPTSLDWEYQTRLYLSHLGFTEIYNYSLISPAQIQKYALQKITHYKLLNPLSADYVFMRPCLLPSLIENYAHQLPEVKHDLRLFELSQVYFPKSSSPLALEIPHLALLSNSLDLAHLKGYLDALARSLNLKLAYVAASKGIPAYFDPANTAQVALNDQVIGYVGALTIPTLFGTEIDYSALVKNANPIHHFQPLSPYNPIIEDLTFTLPHKTPVGPILNFIPNIDPLISKVLLKSGFQQNQTFTIYYQSQKQQLTDLLIAPVRLKLVKKLSAQFQAKLVGEI